MSRRTWIKIFPARWLRGSTREEPPEFRGLLADVLCLAGDTGYDGVIQIAPGVGYTDAQLAALFCVPVGLWISFKTAAIKRNWIKVTNTGDGNVLEIPAWGEYQSEYARQRKFRNPSENRKNPGKVTAVSDKPKLLLEVDVDLKDKEKNSAPAEDAGTPANAGDPPADADPKNAPPLPPFEGAGTSKPKKGAGKSQQENDAGNPNDARKGADDQGSKGKSPKKRKKDPQEGSKQKSLPPPPPRRAAVDALDIQEVYNLYASLVRPYYADEEALKEQAFSFIESALSYHWSVKELGSAVGWFADNGGAKNPDPQYRKQCHTFFNPRNGLWMGLAGGVRKQLNEQRKEAANGQ